MKYALSLSVLGLSVMLSNAAFAESAGEKLFNQKCAMCHKVKGKGGAIGPDLSKVGGKLAEAQLREKLANPKKSNPGSSMPAFATLPKGDMDALVGFLKGLK
ncbi:c-type cytochrome [Trichlorobacter ammonificans]|uniref:Cytochrome c oxidase subunit CcoP n=1 Tax=Trichlorobacter ammonificans TaxID=2916410 RepID=A0ABM9D7P1_9BACT|nr:cytochrome c [Trichlorobacter ammonificans]CAH2030418.1 Cytochrome c oxidase subunit CcoP [Trichlorobacter ammonificans]